MTLLTAGVSSATVGGLNGAVVAASDADAVAGVSISVVVETLPLVDCIVTWEAELPFWEGQVYLGDLPSAITRGERMVSSGECCSRGSANEVATNSACW